MRRLALVLASATLALTACGGGDGDVDVKTSASKSAPAEASGFGEYEGTSADGAKYRLTIDEDPVIKGSLVARTERDRVKKGGEPVHWIAVTVDNTDGDAPFDITDIDLTAVTGSGGQVSVTDPYLATNGWNEYATDVADEWYDQRTNFLPGSKGKVILVFEEKLTSIKGVYADGERLTHPAG